VPAPLLLYAFITPVAAASGWWIGGKATESVIDWGGTPHLENHEAAHQMYKDRIIRWASSSAFPVWFTGELARVQDDAELIYSTTGSAEAYWTKVSQFWNGYANEFDSIDPVQFSKIVAAVGASQDAAETYADNRKLSTHVDIDLPEIPEKAPWWVWAAGGLGLFLVIRRVT
jgi:hypothetical protein